MRKRKRTKINTQATFENFAHKTKPSEGIHSEVKRKATTDMNLSSPHYLSRAVGKEEAGDKWQVDINGLLA